MAFASTTNTQPGPSVVGNLRLIFGTYTNGAADSGGDITTGFSTIVACGTFSTSHVGSSQPKFTVSSGTITLVTENNQDGNWWAIGR